MRRAANDGGFIRGINGGPGESSGTDWSAHGPTVSSFDVSVPAGPTGTIHSDARTGIIAGVNGGFVVNEPFGVG